MKLYSELVQFRDLVTMTDTFTAIAVQNMKSQAQNNDKCFKRLVKMQKVMYKIFNECQDWTITNHHYHELIKSEVKKLKEALPSVPKYSQLERQRPALSECTNIVTNKAEKASEEAFDSLHFESPPSSSKSKPRKEWNISHRRGSSYSPLKSLCPILECENDENEDPNSSKSVAKLVNASLVFDVLKNIRITAIIVGINYNENSVKQISKDDLITIQLQIYSSSQIYNHDYTFNLANFNSCPKKTYPLTLNIMDNL